MHTHTQESYKQILVIFNNFKHIWPEISSFTNGASIKWVEMNGGTCPYLPNSHARLLGYINEEDHVAKSKLAKIPNINIAS